jgi:hypothetical protein
MIYVFNLNTTDNIQTNYLTYFGRLVSRSKPSFSLVPKCCSDFTSRKSRSGHQDVFLIHYQGMMTKIESLREDTDFQPRAEMATAFVAEWPRS